jgi:hypothetical protein
MKFFNAKKQNGNLGNNSIITYNYNKNENKIDKENYLDSFTNLCGANNLLSIH